MSQIGSEVPQNTVGSWESPLMLSGENLGEKLCLKIDKAGGKYRSILSLRNGNIISYLGYPVHQQEDLTVYSLLAQFDEKEQEIFDVTVEEFPFLVLHKGQFNLCNSKKNQLDEFLHLLSKFENFQIIICTRELGMLRYKFNVSGVNVFPK